MKAQKKSVDKLVREAAGKGYVPQVNVYGDYKTTVCPGCKDQIAKALGRIIYDDYAWIKLDNLIIFEDINMQQYRFNDEQGITTKQ